LRGAAKKVTEAERDRGRDGWGRVDEAMEPDGRRRRGRWIALAVAGLFVAVLLILWLERKDIASNYVDRELARRGVRASYKVSRLGFGVQRLDHLVLGDPANPDLTARWVELRLSWGFRKPRISLVTARGVRLYGRVKGGRLRFGELDKLLPKPSGAPFRLPDQNIDLADAAVRIDTPGGRIGAALEGKGNLASGFEGRTAVSAPRLRLGGCALAGGKALWNLATETLQTSLAGPARFESLACGDFLIRRAEARLGATLSASLTAWRGEARLSAAEAQAGQHRIDSVGGTLSFAGGLRDTRGHADLAAAQVHSGGFAAGRTRVNGVYSLSLKNGRLVTALAANAAGVAAPPSLAAPILSALASARGTPVEPVAAAWDRAVSAALRRFDASGDVRLAVERSRGGVRFNRLDTASASGARVSLTGASYAWPGGGFSLDGDLATGGGGLPDARFALRRASPRAPLEGRGRIAPYAAGAARLALADIAFTAAAGETRIDTVATIDGPFSGGRVRGLVLPVSGRIGSGFVFNPRCTPIAFRALETGTLRLGPARLAVCPTGPGLLWRGPGGRVSGGGSIASPRFAGTLGRSPIAIAAQHLQFGLAGPNFTATGLAVRLGPAEAPSRLEIARLTGRFGRGIAGTYSGLSGKLAAVPLLVDQGQGDWAYRDSRLALTGAMRVLDVQNPPRFNPLAAKDVRLTLADNRVAATARLVDPDTGTFVGNADIAHSLATGAGRALIDVPGLRFDPAYQPEQLTRLTTGVVALVNGTVSGRGEIDWNSAGTRSTGTFTTKDMNLAASFGPVEKLSTTVHFTDLLGLVTAPGQIAEVGAVRTGIDVFDGRIRYQLLPGLKVRVEGARWPFAGGELALDETILDFSKPSAKRLTFHVTGMDAARFVQQMEFSNISATGTFDGVVPMLFDERGGQIIGGRLIARPEGGTLSYIGELTDKQLGAYGKLAFDALKSLRYDKLEVELDGYLDGEFVAGIALNGIARDPSVAATPGGGIKNMVANRALTQLAKIPFKFNIKVRGPFRAVIGTARSLSDPTNLLQTVLPQMLRGKPTTTRTVQPQESEKVR
jgi:translocation and assembly module TamB